MVPFILFYDTMQAKSKREIGLPESIKEEIK